MRKEDEKYCSNCGEPIAKLAEICPKCGVRQIQSYSPFNPLPTTDPTISPNSWIVTVLLCGFLGAFGAHRFYNGKIASGIIQLLTLGACGIWYCIDLVFVIIGRFKDGEGRFIRNA